MSKRICYITTVPGSVGFFTKEFQYLEKHGFDITVICSHSDTLQAKLGDSIHFIPVEIPRGVSCTRSIVATLKLVKIFYKERFDLIQYSTPNAAFCASIAAKIIGCKKRNYHLMGLRYLGASGISRIILKAIEKITCLNSTSIECVSKSNMELGIKEGLFPPEKVTVVWNGSTGGVDLSRFNHTKRDLWRKEVREKLGYKKNDFVYGFVGRITRDKGINELVQGFLSLKDDSKLLMIGRIEDENLLDESLMKKAREHPNVCFYGVVTDVERYYAAIDVLILPSYREGFGNVVIEAGAVGTPAIVSDIPGPTDAIDQGKTALVVPVKDVEKLSNAMKHIRIMDCFAMGQNAARFAKERFDSDMLCEKILERKRFLLGK